MDEMEDMDEMDDKAMFAAHAEHMRCLSPKGGAFVMVCGARLRMYRQSRSQCRTCDFVAPTTVYHCCCVGNVILHCRSCSCLMGSLRRELEALRT
jgi:hypothetical protein